jgi:HAD superfamily phosphoserine phosphatase-like hydrolase
MTGTEQFDLQEFFCADEEKVRDKLQGFRDARPDKLHFVFDFDHTLTAAVRSSESVGTWAIVDEFLPSDVRAKHTKIYRHYRPIERSGRMTEAEAVEWWSQTLDLICAARFNLFKTEQSFLGAVKLRGGTKEIFDFCRQLGIPTVIVSAGIRQLIRIFVKHYGLDPDIILSTDLETAGDGRVTGWRSDSLVHALNKKERGHRELLQLCETRPYTILIGDGPEDVHMVEGAEHVLRVCIMDPRKGETFDRTTFLETAFGAGFDLVAGTSLLPLVPLLRSVAAGQ